MNLARVKRYYARGGTELGAKSASDALLQTSDAHKEAEAQAQLHKENVQRGIVSARLARPDPTDVVQFEEEEVVWLGQPPLPIRVPKIEPDGVVPPQPPVVQPVVPPVPQPVTPPVPVVPPRRRGVVPPVPAPERRRRDPPGFLGGLARIGSALYTPTSPPSSRTRRRQPVVEDLRLPPIPPEYKRGRRSKDGPPPR